jgi:hypothetical protein
MFLLLYNFNNSYIIDSLLYVVTLQTFLISLKVTKVYDNNILLL